MKTRTKYGLLYVVLLYFCPQAELKQNFQEKECPKFYGNFETMLKNNGTGFFVGSEVCIIIMFAAIFYSEFSLIANIEIQ